MGWKKWMPTKIVFFLENIHSCDSNEVSVAFLSKRNSEIQIFEYWCPEMHFTLLALKRPKMRAVQRIFSIESWGVQTIPSLHEVGMDRVRVLPKFCLFNHCHVLAPWSSIKSWHRWNYANFCLFFCDLSPSHTFCCADLRWPHPGVLPFTVQSVSTRQQLASTQVVLY